AELPRECRGVIRFVRHHSAVLRRLPRHGDRMCTVPLSNRRKSGGRAAGRTCDRPEFCVSWSRRYAMRSRLAVLLLLLLVPATARAQRTPDWKAVEAE